MDINPQPTPPEAPTPPTPTPQVPFTPNISSKPESILTEDLAEPDSEEVATTETEEVTAEAEPAEPAEPVTFVSTLKEQKTSFLEAVNPSGENPGFKFGIISLLFALVALGLISVIFGVLGYKKSKKAGYSNYFAVAGIIIGAIEVVIGTLIIGLVLISLPDLLGATE